MALVGIVVLFFGLFLFVIGSSIYHSSQPDPYAPYIAKWDGKESPKDFCDRISHYEQSPELPAICDQFQPVEPPYDGPAININPN